MKKHNETKSTMGYRHSKGKALYKVTIFTLIFVMLFCISAYAEYKTQTITVKDQNNKIKSIEVNTYYNEIEDENKLEIEKIIYLDKEDDVIASGLGIQYDGVLIALYGIQRERVAQGGVITDLRLNEIANIQITESEVSELNLSLTKLMTLDGGNIGEYTPNNINEVNEYLSIIETKAHQIKTRTNYQENIIIYAEPPVYEGFIGNARGLFDMIFESMQSIFNWLVSPNVIVFFGLGIILSITTIGILIARRFFWGR